MLLLMCCVFGNVVYFLSRFHFAQAIFGRIKNKYHLGHYAKNYSRNENDKWVSSLLHQLMSLPVLKARDMENEVRLEIID